VAAREAEAVTNLLYEIPDYLHVCVTTEGSVLLDLKRDRYVGLGRSETEILAGCVRAWPRPVWEITSTRCGPIHQHEADALCDSLRSRGLLIPASRGAGGAQTTFGEGTVTVCGASSRRDMRGVWVSIGDELEVHHVINWQHCRNFLSALLWARCALALRPFWRTVGEVQSRKARQRAAKSSWNCLEVAGLVDVFRQMRPFAFGAEGHCLLHALAMIRFFSYYGFYPEWVVGVMTRPWAAHSWVQWKDFLLDTNPEKVCAYTPILIV
jgi:hypothetical protein